MSHHSGWPLPADLEGTPSVVKLEQYLKQLFEPQCFTQRSLAHKLERYHCEDVCLADLEARPGACLYFGTGGRDPTARGGLHREDGKIPRLVAQVEEKQRSYAENVHRLNIVSAREQELEVEEEDYESAQDEDESEQVEYDDYCETWPFENTLICHIICRSDAYSTYSIMTTLGLENEHEEGENELSIMHHGPRAKPTTCGFPSTV